jgi:sugar transferase (PEP-CTERM/EpsH1 system associated)
MKAASEETVVVHVLHSFGTGGLEKGIATLARNASSNFRHIILCLATSGESRVLLPPDVEIHEMNKAAGNSILFLLRLSRKLRSLRPDVVHTRNWGGIDGIMAAKFAGIQSVIQGEHGWAMDDPEGLNKRRLIARRYLSRWVQEFTCVSRHIERWLIDEVGIRRPINQIYNGVDTTVFYPADGDLRIRKGLGISEKAFVLGVVSRLDPIKEHPTLLAAFEELRKHRSDARLLVVGDGPERRHLECLAGEGIHFLGNRIDVPEILRSLDVFVLPSLNEGISNTILEAMASGLPVAVTSVGGNKEIVEENVNGMLFRPRDVQALVSILTKYLVDVDVAKAHGRSGRSKACNLFGISKMINSYESIYRRVCGLGPKGN